MKPIVKISLLAGCIFGAVMGISVALSLNFMMGSTLGGSWYESVKHDIRLIFGAAWATKDWLVSLGVVVVIGGIGIIGAIIGAIFGTIVGKVFSIIMK